MAPEFTYPCLDSLMGDRMSLQLLCVHKTHTAPGKGTFVRFLPRVFAVMNFQRLSRAIALATTFDGAMIWLSILCVIVSLLVFFD